MALIANNIISNNTSKTPAAKAPVFSRQSVSFHIPKTKPAKRVSDYHYDMKTITKR